MMSRICKRLFRAEQFHIGEGNISGYIACFLAMLSCLGVLAFHLDRKSVV